MRSLCYVQIGEIEGGKKDIDQKVEFLGVKYLKIKKIIYFSLFYFTYIFLFSKIISSIKQEFGKKQRL